MNTELELEICPFCEQEECDCGAEYPLTPELRRTLLGKLEYIGNALCNLSADAPLLTLPRIQQDAASFREMILEIHNLILEKTSATYPSRLRAFLHTEGGY